MTNTNTPQPQPHCLSKHDTWICTQPEGHTGEHKATGVYGKLYQSWPQEKPKVSTEHPSMFAKGGIDATPRVWAYSSGRGFGKTAAMEAAKAEYSHNYTETMDKFYEVQSKLKTVIDEQGVSVLLTVEDLKVIAYYLSAVDDEDDVAVKEKIDAALKAAL